MLNLKTIEKTQDEINKTSTQINEKRQDIKYDTRDYVIDYLVTKYENDGLFYVPVEYQRNFVWNEKTKCYFIESLLMGLPIPFMFFADTDDGRLEIVDGAQRMQTMVDFVNNKIKLASLDVLTNANGLCFENLEQSIQRRFLNTNIRVVFLEQGTTISTRQEIFKRINTAGLELKPSEVRRGSYEGKFHDFLSECTRNALFNELAPRTEQVEKRYEGLELILRFFAYLNNYENGYKDYDGRVRNYLDSYLIEENERFKEENEKLKTEYISEFETMLRFAEGFLGERGFRKVETGKATPRARFEALSVGIALALREKPDLKVDNNEWINSQDFLEFTKSDAANNKNNLLGRINYVKDSLLKGS